MLDPIIIKQKTHAWQHLKRNAIVTGGTTELLTSGIWKKGILQKGAHRDSLAKFCQHIIPMWFSKKMDVHWKMETEAEPYAVFSGEGTLVRGNGDNLVAVEFKCPMPNKQYTTDTYCKLPYYYTALVLRQMAVKERNIMLMHRTQPNHPRSWPVTITQIL